MGLMVIHGLGMARREMHGHNQVFRVIHTLVMHRAIPGIHGCSRDMREVHMQETAGTIQAIRVVLT